MRALFLPLLLVSLSVFSADTSISNLPAASALTGTEVFPTTQSGTTKKATAAQVATYTRSVTTKSDVGLGNVDNTSDANKPVSTATQTALDLKAPLASPALTGTPTAPTAAVGTNTTQVATTAGIVAERAATATLTNKTISGSNNTLSNIANASLTNSAITINGTSTSLGGTRSLSLASADFANQGTTTTVLHGNASGNPSFGAVSLSSDVTGTLADGSLSANVPLLNAANTFTNVVGLSTPAIAIASSGTAPGQGIYSNAASTLAIRTSGTNQITVSATGVNIQQPVTTTGLITGNVGMATRKGSVTISSTERVKVGGVSYQNTTTTGNTAATETDAFSHTLTAATLGSDGESLEFEAAGTIAGTANTDKRIKVVFGSTTLFDSGTLAITSAASWNLKGTIVRTGAATQKATVTLTTSSTVLPATSTYSAPTETLANALTLKLTVNGTSANDTVAQFFKEQWLPFQ